MPIVQTRIGIWLECAEQCGNISLVFSPHLIPMSRGILSSCYLTLSEDITEQDIVSVYSKAYDHAPFVNIKTTDNIPTTQNVVGSNFCQLTIQKISDNQVVVFSAIDNLIKGAAGNAIQNMNIMFGLDQSTGLPIIAQRV